MFRRIFLGGPGFETAPSLSRQHHCGVCGAEIGKRLLFDEDVQAISFNSVDLQSWDCDPNSLSRVAGDHAACKS